MEWILWVLLILLGALAVYFLRKRKRGDAGKRADPYDSNGFDSNHIHRNGTKYGDDGFDYYGYNQGGFNRFGYNQQGKNEKGQYNRYFDLAGYYKSSTGEDGFLNPHLYPVSLSPHARARILERVEFLRGRSPEQIAEDAYKYGKSARQMRKSSAPHIREIEEKHGGIVLMYQNYIFIFSQDNVLKTMYKNDKIPQ